MCVAARKESSNPVMGAGLYKISLEIVVFMTTVLSRPPSQERDRSASNCYEDDGHGPGQSY